MAKAKKKNKSKDNAPSILELSREQIAERLRKELAKTGGAVSKFLSLMESFRVDFPDEDKCINAALKAMDHAAGLDKEDIIDAALNQISILQKQKKLFSQALDAKRDEMQSSALRAKEIKARLDELNREIRHLREEHEVVLAEAANGEEMIKKAGVRMEEAARMLADELSAIKDKVEHHRVSAVPTSATFTTSTSSAQEPSPSPSDEKMETMVSSLDMDVGSMDSGDKGAQGEDSGEQKPCPRCGGELAWYELYEKWGCYSCGYQEEEDES